MRLYLHKNDLSKNPKLPYFSLKLVPEDGNDGEWKTIGAFWKAASGKGYNGKLEEGVEVDITNLKGWEPAPKGHDDANAELNAVAEEQYGAED